MSLAQDAPLVDYFVDPPLDDELRSSLIGLWRDVANAGGSVGLRPPVSFEDAESLADVAFRRVADEEDHLLVALIGDEPIGLVFLEQRPGPLFAHWATIKRLQVHPALQGQGIGAALMEKAHTTARSLGLEQLHLTVRSGTGTEEFYKRFGYWVVAVIPGAIRVTKGDDRDELYMVVRL